MPQVRPGIYRLTAEKEGFKTLTREPVRVLVGTPISMELGAVTERVTVQETPPAVNTVDATIGHAFNEEEVQRLPFVARNPINLLTFNQPSCSLAIPIRTFSSKVAPDATWTTAKAL